MTRSTRTFVSLMVMLGLAVGLGPPAAAASPDAAVRVPVDDFTNVELNPCTGQLTEVVFTDLAMLMRESTDGAGNLHLLMTLRGSWSSADGFSGRYVDPFVVNDFDPGSFDDFTVRDLVKVVGGDGSGTRVVSTLLFHIRVKDGEGTGLVETVDARCLGRR